MGGGASKYNVGPLPPLKQGQVDIDRYRVTVYPNIGSGAFGQVCKGFDKHTRRYIAAKGIKVVSGGQTYSDLEKMAISEGEKMRAIDFIHIVKLFSYCKHEDTIWLFMEFCDLGDFDFYMKNNPTLPTKKRVKMLYEITCAVAYLHHHKPPIIHRDIKPGNALMKTVGGRHIAKLTDFGYAKLYDYSLSNPTFSTMINKSSAGTPMYSAPEFFLMPNDSLAYTASVDIFSLGLLNAVLLQYSPENKSTFPNSVANRKRNKSSIFGRDMANAFKGGEPLPRIVAIEATDSTWVQNMKRLISSMIEFDGSNRPLIEEVRCNLEQLQESALMDMALHNEMKKVKEVTLSDWPFSLKLIDNELWSCQGDGIGVYDKELNWIRSMRGHGDDPWVYTVALLHDDTVAVGGREQLYQISKSGMFIQKIREATYSDLAFHNMQLYATGKRSPAIHVYNCRKWDRLRSINIPCRNTKHLLDEHRISVNLQHIKLSCWDSNEIYNLDKNGRLKQSYGSNITITVPSSSWAGGEQSTESSKLYRPRICQEDEDGAVLVDDFGNNRMLILTSDAQWRRVRLSGKMKRLDDAVRWHGRLYVSAWGDSNTLTMFQ